jgi:hypothetical protein
VGRTYVKVEMGEYFASVFVPSDVGSRLASGHADEGNLVPQDVLVIEMGGQGDFSPLRKPRMRGCCSSQANTYVVVVVILVRFWVSVFTGDGQAYLELIKGSPEI